VTYTEYDAPVLESSRSGGQDAWIGTGSVVKVDDVYYLFYTGHNGASNMEFKEKVMVAKSDNLYSFEKIEGWYITPPADLRQKYDFRDPQCYYDPATGKISMTLAPDGRRIMIAWMQNWDTCDQNGAKERKWFGQMTLPRELSIEHGRLYQRPIRELDAHRHFLLRRRSGGNGYHEVRSVRGGMKNEKIPCDCSG
jgi:sucrose-6-phosphate hydrolase SacC (GH32 family)